MSIEAADLFLPEDGDISQTFDVVRALHGDVLEDEARIVETIAAGNPSACADVLHAGLAFLANRSKSAHIRKLGDEAWPLIVTGKQGIFTAFCTNAPSVLHSITGIPIDEITSDGYLSEGIPVTTMPAGNGAVVCIVPTSFIIQTQRNPVEAMSNLASAASVVRDLERMMAMHLVHPNWTDRMLQHLESRRIAASAQMFLEAGETYTPSSPQYAEHRRAVLAAFPQGMDSLPPAALTPYPISPGRS